MGIFFVKRYSFTTIFISLKLTLEWATLSKYTGNDTYRALAEKSARQIANNPAPLPGLPAGLFKFPTLLAYPFPQTCLTPVSEVASYGAIYC